MFYNTKHYSVYLMFTRQRSCLNLMHGREKTATIKNTVLNRNLYVEEMEQHWNMLERKKTINMLKQNSGKYHYCMSFATM